MPSALAIKLVTELLTRLSSLSKVLLVYARDVAIFLS